MNLLPNMNLIADSLGWAVLHSLWQGALAAGIVYAVRNLTRERASEARYFTGIITLCALLCAFVGTFLYYYYTGTATMSAGLGGAETFTLTLPGAAETATTNPLLRLGDFTGLIGVFWAICFVILGGRYLGAFHLTYKLRKHGLSDLPADCQARFRTLVELSGVTPKVRAYFSKHVSSPITFGFFKPVVLVPTWFFTGMSPEQCEAVLLHELAHIRRHDYLTNILQIAIKTVFFYHPAVQFICKGLDTDREHACDDFAVMLTKNPEGLATALGTIRLKAAKDGGVFALSADGRDAPLMHRLKRLMGTQGNSMSKGTSRGIAATALISSALALVMTLGATSSQAHPHKENKIEAPESEKASDKEWDKLAGAANPTLSKQAGTRYVEVNGKTFQAGQDELNALNNITTIGDGKGKTYHIINGKKYPAKYQYSMFSRNGKNYVAKKKNGNWYMEIGDNWYRADGEKVFASVSTPIPPAAPSGYSYAYVTKGGENFKVKTKHKTGKSYIKVDGNWDPVTVFTTNENHGHDHIKINGKTYNLNRYAKPQTPTAPPATRETTNYWVSDQVRAATEARAEAATERREAAFERAEEVREREMERAEEARERAEERREEALEREMEREMERAEEAREAAAERAETQREASLERNEQQFAADAQRKADRKIRDYERQIAKMERKIAHKERDLARDEAELNRDIARVERDIEKKRAEVERKLHNNPNMSEGELGHMQGEIGRLQGEIGRLQGQRGYNQGELGRMQGELGRLQGEIGRIQGDMGRQHAEVQQKKYYKMRDRLTRQLKTDGYMKSDKTKVTIKMTEADIFINGKQLTNSQEGKYCDIVSDYMERKGDMKTIIIKPGSLQISTKGDKGNHRVTYGSFTHN